MTDYANNNYNSNSPYKDIAMIFIKPLLSSQTVMTSDHQMERFQGKILEVIGPLSHLWKGLKDIRKAPSDKTVDVPVDKSVTLVEQVILLLGQTSLSVPFTLRLKIFKKIMKDPRKANAMLKENENILKESETQLFGKKFLSDMTEIEKSRKKTLEAFKDVGEKKSTFRKGPSHSQNKPHGRGCYYYAGKQGNRDQHKHGKLQSPSQYNSGRKFQHGSSATHGKYLFRKSKGVLFHQQLKFLPLASMTFIHPVVRKLSTKEIQNVPLAGRLSQFVKQWEKKYTRPRNYVNSERISDTIHKSPSYGKASTIKMSKK